jgi:hypothetical protein
LILFGLVILIEYIRYFDTLSFQDDEPYNMELDQSQTYSTQYCLGHSNY